MIIMLDSIVLIQYINEATHQYGHLLDYITSTNPDELVVNCSMPILLLTSMTCMPDWPADAPIFLKDVNYRSYFNIDFVACMHDIE